jgi:nucleotide-binding universal stress UspA family protein
MKFLAAVDLSEASLLSLDVLASLPVSEGSEATLLHVVDLDLYTAGGFVPGIMEFAEKRLHEESERLSGCGLRAPAIRVEQGDTAQTILHVAAEEQADLVVMTNLGKGARTGRLFGSTAERLASHGTVPVLIERVGFDEGNGGKCCRVAAGSPFERTMIAVDIDHDPHSLFAFVGGLPGVGTTRVIHVVRRAEELDEASKRFEALMQAGPDDMRAEPEVLVGDPAQVVAETAAEWGATTIALGPCAHGAFHRAVWGSVARSVALHANCSILFVPLARPEGS